ALMPAVTSWSATDCAASMGTATIAIWIPRAFTSRPRSRLAKIGVDSTPAATLAGSSSEKAAIPKSLPAKAPQWERPHPRVAEADERYRPLAIEAEDALQLGLEPRDVVADATDAELAEVGEVFSDLRRIEIEAVGQLLRGHRLDAVFLQLQQAPSVDRETTD